MPSEHLPILRSVEPSGPSMAAPVARVAACSRYLDAIEQAHDLGVIDASTFLAAIERRLRAAEKRFDRKAA